MNEAMKLVAAFASLVNSAYPIAVGPPGQPGDAGDIIYIAQGIARVHRRLIDWSLEMKSAIVDDGDIAELMRQVSRLTAGVIEETESKAQQYFNSLSEVLPKIGETKSQQPLQIVTTFVLAVPEDVLKQVEESTQTLARKYGFPFSGFNVI